MFIFSVFKNIFSKFFLISMFSFVLFLLSSCSNNSAKEEQQKKEDAAMKAYFVPHKMQKSYQTQMGNVQTYRIPENTNTKKK